MSDENEDFEIQPSPPEVRGPEKTIHVVCPECENKDRVGFTPTISIGFDAEVTITEVRCSECGYEGEP